MAFLIGVILAVSVGLSASLVGFDRDRAFYPAVMIVIAMYYALFAVMSGSVEVLALELPAIVVFVAAAVVGFRRSLWLVVAALIAHGIYDVSHGQLFSNPGVPAWWPDFCLAYDVAAGLYLAWRLEADLLHARRNTEVNVSAKLESGA